ncbi:MAG: helix-turn-helix domain-containing protein [Chitinophagaceae bacterium]
MIVTDNETEVLNKVADICSEVFNIPKEYLNHISKDREVTLFRHTFYWIMRKYHPNVTLKKIGLFTKRDHASVIHGAQKINDRIETNDPDCELILKAKEVYVSRNVKHQLSVA